MMDDEIRFQDGIIVISDRNETVEIQQIATRFKLWHTPDLTISKAKPHQMIADQTILPHTFRLSKPLDILDLSYRSII